MVRVGMRRQRMYRWVAAFAMMATPAMAFDDPITELEDPFRTGMWNYHQVEILGNPENIRFDDRVKVLAPASAEDSFHVPVLVDATEIDNVRRIIVAADYGPIPKVLTYWPEEAEAKLSFRFKIDQATPIRAAVETHDGTWHVGGTAIDAAGGGCAAPAAAYANANWEDNLGKVRGRVWPDSGRARLIVSHPMDTGLFDGIPIFIIENLDIKNDQGEKIARIDLHEPVNEDPAFTLYFPEGELGNSLQVTGRDNNGNEIDSLINAVLSN